MFHAETFSHIILNSNIQSVKVCLVSSLVRQSSAFFRRPNRVWNRRRSQRQFLVGTNDAPASSFSGCQNKKQRPLRVYVQACHAPIERKEKELARFPIKRAVITDSLFAIKQSFIWSQAVFGRDGCEERNGFPFLYPFCHRLLPLCAHVRLSGQKTGGLSKESHRSRSRGCSGNAQTHWGAGEPTSSISAILISLYSFRISAECMSWPRSVSLSGISRMVSTPSMPTIHGKPRHTLSNP